MNIPKGYEHIYNISISYTDKIVEQIMEDKIPFYKTFSMQNPNKSEIKYEIEMEIVK